MLNLCQFIGHTGKDVDLRYTASGQAVAAVSLACTEKWKDKSGEQKERTEWVNLVAWAGLAETLAKYVKKGDMIYVAGKLQSRSYDDKNGNKRYITELIVSEMKMLGGKKNGDRAPHPADDASSPAAAESQAPNQAQASSAGFNPDDDIPF